MIPKILTFAIIALFFISTTSAFESKTLLRACKRDLKKFGCEVETEAQAHECLERNEVEKEKNEGLSRRCQMSHEAYKRRIEKEKAKEEAEEAPKGAKKEAKEKSKEHKS
jgi:hypothetical protein